MLYCFVFFCFTEIHLLPKVLNRLVQSNVYVEGNCFHSSPVDIHTKLIAYLIWNVYAIKKVSKVHVIRSKLLLLQAIHSHKSNRQIIPLGKLTLDNKTHNTAQIVKHRLLFTIDLANKAKKVRPVTAWDRSFFITSIVQQPKVYM